jgi:ornithine cyclodeaminase/alanine dehydrogenase-like protein (mu-crystallin family)
LTEADVERLLTPADAVATVEDSFRRLAAGVVENVPRYRVRLDDGALAVMSAVDSERRLGCVKTYTAASDGAAFVVVLFECGATRAVIEADRLGRLRTGAASAVAARYLARARMRGRSA